MISAVGLSAKSAAGKQNPERFQSHLRYMHLHRRFQYIFLFKTLLYYDIDISIKNTFYGL